MVHGFFYNNKKLSRGGLGLVLFCYYSGGGVGRGSYSIGLVERDCHEGCG